MIKATDKPWNSATTLYIARRLREIANGRRIAVLDIGCGDGRVLECLLDHGYDLYGYELGYYEEQYDVTRRKRLAPYFGDSYDEHLKVTQSERAIPFDDDSFNVVYANQVFEHVKFLDKMMSECARVLKPNGMLLTTFPLATHPIEVHVRIPFAHWLPPGARVRYLQLLYALGLGPRKKELSTLERAIELDRYLREETYYRFVNEILMLSQHYFESCEIETEALVRAKIDMLMAEKKPSRRKLGAFARRFGEDNLGLLVTHLLNAAFCMRNPRKDNIPQDGDC